ncbi:helix-turn-helix transcriptional regulator [Haloechinothrix sp. LS1_15]|uniref:helix-turn-helix domain-containing protein n=1 Tax=Haloechinothrix sp. LS1_15 TaxID=2652248 RepID=UPI0029459413|nr:helix-turn-helix transcriptional regulator [Haloechinothrix sp. LS1_15]MDV6014075.1 helix-turn-helix domain-containing protein [Haloechinothrix sp. LS1_15]
MASTADTPRARQLGAELRQARTEAGLTTTQLGKQLGRSHTHVSRWENGKLAPSAEDTAAVLGILGVTGEERDRLLDLARAAADPNWVAPGVDKQLAALREYERTASMIIDVEPMLIPGLMQTPAYARQIITEFGATSGEADHRSMVRLGRQHVLTDDPPVTFHAIIGEYALRYQPCTDDVMVGQLRHLAKLAQADNVTVQVLPIGVSHAAAMTGPWVWISFTDDSKPVVHLEHYCSSATITDERTVERYKIAADTLCEAAMSPSESIELIATISAGKERAE